MKNEFMKKAIELSIESVNKNGGPFGSVVVKDNKIIAKGSNKVTFSNDPNAADNVIPPPSLYAVLLLISEYSTISAFSVELFEYMPPPV